MKQNQIRHKLQKLTKPFCREGTNVKSVFSRFKLTCLSLTKDKVPYGLKSYVIYKFFCASCNASYVVETYRPISNRTHEHLETDKSSNIYRHILKNPQCKSICYENCFSILDLAGTKYTLKMKKVMYIKWLKPCPRFLYRRTIQCFSRSSSIMPFRYLHVL